MTAAGFGEKFQVSVREANASSFGLASVPPPCHPNTTSKAPCLSRKKRETSMGQPRCVGRVFKLSGTRMSALHKKPRDKDGAPQGFQNKRSLHSTNHRLAMICFGRDDRVGEGPNIHAGKRAGPPWISHPFAKNAKGWGNPGTTAGPLRQAQGRLSTPPIIALR